MNRIGVVLGTMCLAGPLAFGVGTLGIGELEVEGSQVVVPIVLGGDLGTGVSAMDFRLRYDPAELQPVSASPGPCAVRADKQVMANVRAPGEYVVVMMGQRSTCRAGEVVHVVMNRVGAAQDRNWGLALHQQTLSSAEGAVIDSRAIPFDPGSTVPASDADEEDTPADEDRTDAGSGVARVPAQPDEAPGQNLSPGTAAIGRASAAAPGRDQTTGTADDAGAGRERLAAAMAEAGRARAGLDTPRPAREGALEGRLQDDALDKPSSQAPDAGHLQARSHGDRPVAASGQTRIAQAKGDAQTIESSPDRNAGDTTPTQARNAAVDSPPGNQLVKGALIAAVIVLGAAGVLIVRRRLFG